MGSSDGSIDGSNDRKVEGSLPGILLGLYVWGAMRSSVGEKVGISL